MIATSLTDNGSQAPRAIKVMEIKKNVGKYPVIAFFHPFDGLERGIFELEKLSVIKYHKTTVFILLQPYCFFDRVQTVILTLLPVGN